MIHGHKNYKYIREVYRNIYDGWMWLDFVIMMVFFVDWVASIQKFAYFKIIIIIKLGHILNKITNL